MKKKFSDEFRIKILKMIDAGEKPSVVAKKFGLNAKGFTNWRQSLHKKGKYLYNPTKTTLDQISNLKEGKPSVYPLVGKTEEMFTDYVENITNKTLDSKDVLKKLAELNKEAEKLVNERDFYQRTAMNYLKEIRENNNGK